MPSISNLDPNTLLTLGVVCSLLGAIHLFARRFRFILLAALVSAAAFLPWVIVEFVLDLPINMRWYLTVAIALPIVFLVGHSTVLSSLAARSAIGLRRPAFIGGTLVALGLFGIGYASYRSEPTDTDLAEFGTELEPESPRSYVPAEGLSAVTDRGTAIPMLRLANADSRNLEIKDRQLAQSKGHQDYLIRTSGPSNHCNCHGWVFTGGLCWIASDSVDSILLENEYELIATPAAGDIVVYRNNLAKVSHSGIVRAVWPDGRVLVESKWGVFGSFVHFVDHSVYPGTWSFYHSKRTGHILRGLPNSLDGTRSSGLN